LAEGGVAGLTIVATQTALRHRTATISRRRTRRQCCWSWPTLPRK
jgi:hypothetical protein